MKLINTLAATSLTLFMFVSPLSAQKNLPQCCALVELNACYNECHVKIYQCSDDPSDSSCADAEHWAADICESDCRELAPDNCSSGTDKWKMQRLFNEDLCTMKKEK